MKKKVILRVTVILLFFLLSGFNSCDTVSSCWICENPRDINDWQQVCNSMSKNKLESYGYDCTPY